MGNFGDIKKNYRGNWEILEILRRITGDIGKFRRYSEELQGILGNFGDIRKNYRGYWKFREI